MQTSPTFTDKELQTITRIRKQTKSFKRQVLIAAGVFLLLIAMELLMMIKAGGHFGIVGAGALYAAIPSSFDPAKCYPGINLYIAGRAEMIIIFLIYLALVLAVLFAYRQRNVLLLKCYDLIFADEPQDRHEQPENRESDGLGNS